MEITAIQSSPFASTMGIPGTLDSSVMITADYSRDVLKDAIEKIDICCRIDYDENDGELFAKALRQDRKSGADEFRAEYIFGRCKDQKTCIWRGHRQPWSSDDSSGITWVGVHGNDSICVVTKAGVLDVTRVHGSLQFNTMEDVEPLFRRAMISEMEDLADPEDSSSKPHELRDKSINKPFSVVSVVPDTNKVHDDSGDDEYEDSKIVKYKLEYLHKLIKNGEVSDDESSVGWDTYIKNDVKQCIRRQCEWGIHESHEDSIFVLKDKLKRDATSPIKEAVQADECDEKGAIEFLEEEMKKPAEHFTKDETIKTAISAFQRLFNKKLKAKEIGVSVMYPNYIVIAEKGEYIDPYAQHLEENEIENYLSDISEPESQGSCSLPTPKRLKCYA